MDRQEKPIEMYLKAMYEFKQRILFVGSMCENIYMVKKAANIIDIENICLQIRKLLELIAMSSLIMNKQAFQQAGEKFAKMWNAKYILKDIKRIHSEYFPITISGVLKEDENGHSVMDEIDYEVLTEDTFCKIYDKCGKALHVPNPFSVDDNIIKEFWDVIPKWLDLILLTMEKHIVFLYGTDFAYAIELNELSANISYTLLKKKQKDVIVHDCTED